jgi:hypothetical protein
LCTGLLCGRKGRGVYCIPYLCYNIYIVSAKRFSCAQQKMSLTRATTQT